jgi:transcriptional repressor of cell division inhibition gene dicB
MDMREALEWYGTKTRIAEALRIKLPSVAEWGNTIPPLRQLQLERLTKGGLRADDDILDVRTQKVA